MTTTTPVARVVPLAEANSPLRTLTEYMQAAHTAENAARSLYANHPELRPWVQRVTLRETNGQPRIDLWVVDAGGVRVWAAALGLSVVEHASTMPSALYHHSQADGEFAGVPLHVWACRQELVNKGGTR